MNTDLNSVSNWANSYELLNNPGKLQVPIIGEKLSAMVYENRRLETKELSLILACHG